MSIFGKIKDAIFGREAQAAPQAAPVKQPTQTMGQQMGGQQTMERAAAPATAPRLATADEIDQRLAAIAAKKGAPSNYNSSIVDLMKLLDLDSSLANRKELAGELGYTGDTDDSATMNIWLHGEVMKSLAKRGA